MEAHSIFWSRKHDVAVHDDFHILWQSIANVSVENLILKYGHLELSYKIRVL